MRVFDGIAKLRGPKGLAARAVAFTCGLLAITAVLSAATILYGADRESARRQIEITGELDAHLANVSGNMIVAGDLHGLQQMVEVATSRREVRRISVRDGQGSRVVESGGSAADIAAVDALATQILATMRPGYLRQNGGIVLASPIMHQGRYMGVALMMWDGDAYRFNAVPALAPFLVLLLCLTAAAIPLTAHFVRKAIAPLDALSQFAARVTDQGQVHPIDMKTGDEFETLANAFNQMMERVQASMRRIQEIAFVDPATQLPNQDRFVREVDYQFLQTKPESGQAGAVLVIELQRLPKLLQTLDPDAAREFLRVIADRFAGAAQTVDRAVGKGRRGEGPLICARLAQVEFAVFAPGLAAPADAARFAQHLNAALNHPFDWRGHKLMLGASCGVAIGPRDGASADAVIRHARMALTAAHEAPARLKVFTPSLDREAVARLTLEREMRGALERNEFRAYFQPKINLTTGRIEACEALARWIRPDRTIVSPGRFIPVAEESGLIGPLSEAIMREACWKAASWARAGMPANVSVNVSALQFRNDRFAEHVLQIVQHAGLAPERLELEITETVVMEDPDRAARIIKPLREQGVRLAIDDFGCGHSSLAALSRLPFDVIKIDQMFVRQLNEDSGQSAAIIEMILALARTLKLEVVAEGVERPEHVAFMAARGCHWVQGFLYGAAVSAPEFAEALRQQAGEDIVSEDAA